MSIKELPEEYKEKEIKEELKRYDSYIEDQNKEIDMLIKALNGYEVGDLNKILDYQIHTIDSGLKVISDMQDDPPNVGGYNPIPESTLKAAKSQYQIISERNIRSLFPGEYLITAWVDYKPDKLEYQ